MPGREDQYADWVEGWRRAVRAVVGVAGLLELDSHLVLALSDEAGEVLRVLPDDAAGVEFPALAERPEQTARTIELVRDGQIDSLQSRRVVRRADGTAVELPAAGWAVRSPSGPDLGLWVVRAVDDDPVQGIADAAAGSAPPTGYRDTLESAPGEAQVTLDALWRVTGVTGELGIDPPPADPVGVAFLDLVHPADRMAVLVAFARATVEPTAEVSTNMASPGGAWGRVWLTVAVSGSIGTVTYRLRMSAEPSRISGVPPRMQQLEVHLKRIASEVRAAGLFEQTPAVDLARFPGLRDLSERQREVLSRLLRGQRVAAMARDMYLSPATVRNHLTAVFRKAGVHSQHELLALVQRPVTDHIQEHNS